HSVSADDRGDRLPSGRPVRKEPSVSRLVLVFALAALVALPAYAGEFYINLASQILIAAIVAMSLNLLVGYGGLTSLGHASFVGFAAYVYAWLAVRLGVENGFAALL